MAICGCLWEEKKEMWDKVKIDRELRKMLKIHEEILLTGFSTNTMGYHERMKCYSSKCVKLTLILYGLNKCYFLSNV